MQQTKQRFTRLTFFRHSLSICLFAGLCKCLYVCLSVSFLLTFSFFLFLFLCIKCKWTFFSGILFLLTSTSICLIASLCTSFIYVGLSLSCSLCLSFFFSFSVYLDIMFLEPLYKSVRLSACLRPFYIQIYI